MESSDTSRLVRRALSGDVEAFGDLAERYRDAVFALCYHRCDSFETARDLAQEAFLRAYQHLGQLGDPARFPAWLRRIAERVCIDWRRGRREERALEEGPTEATLPPDRLAVLRVTVERALSALPEAQRLAITLYHIDGYSYREIADFLGTSETTVKGRLDSGRAGLRGALADVFREAIQAQRPGDEFREEVMMRVTQVQVKQAVNLEHGGPARYLVLGDDERAIAMEVGDYEARSIRAVLDRWELPRPMTYDLMLSTWAAFGIRVRGVRITDLRESIFFAELVLARGKTAKHVDCRPSDAVNVALRADVPVEIEEAVMEKAAVSAEQARLDYGTMRDCPAEEPDLPPLHRAAADGNTEEVERLLRDGEGPDRPNRHGVTALRVAINRGHTQVAKLLMDDGADVNGRDKEGRCHLHFASHSGHLEVTGALLAAGADINTRDDGGATPLHVACGPGMVDLLLARDADANARDAQGRTPLHYAASNGRGDVVEALLRGGADREVEDHEGATALMVAENEEVAGLLRGRSRKG